MVDVRLSHAVCAFVDAILLRSDFRKRSHEDPDRLVSVSLDVRLKNKATGRSVSRVVRFLFSRPSNYTRVLFCVSERFHPLASAENDWQDVSYHDSCWRDDGVGTPLSRVYFEMADAIRNEAPPCDMEQTAYVMDVAEVTIAKLVPINDGGPSYRKRYRPVFQKPAHIV